MSGWEEEPNDAEQNAWRPKRDVQWDQDEHEIETKLLESPFYRPVIRLETVTPREVRAILTYTYVLSVFAVAYTYFIDARTDHAVRAYALTPLLAFGYLVFLAYFLRACCCDCRMLFRGHCRRVREQVWILLTLVVCALCAGEMAYRSLARGHHIPNELLLTSAAGAALASVLKLLWLLLMDSFGREHIDSWCAFYTPKLLFVAANAGAEVYLVLHRYPRYGVQVLVTTWTFYVIWGIWLFATMWYTRRALAGFAFIQTRMRQLGFRFFCFQTTIVVISMLLCLGIDAKRRINIITGYQLVAHGYMLLLGWCYVPAAPERGKRFRFCTLETEADESLAPLGLDPGASYPMVKACLLASWEAYNVDDKVGATTGGGGSMQGGWAPSGAGAAVTLGSPSREAKGPSQQHQELRPPNTPQFAPENVSTAYGGSSNPSTYYGEGSAYGGGEGSPPRDEGSVASAWGREGAASAGSESVASGTWRAAAGPRRMGGSEGWVKIGGWLTPASRRPRILRTITSDDEILCIVAEVQAPQCVLVAFRGTASYYNLLRTDCVTWRASPDDYGKGSRRLHLYNRGVRVHKGFWSAYMSVRSELIRTLSEYNRRTRREFKRSAHDIYFGTTPTQSPARPEPTAPTSVPILCTGHSMGGALACLAALDLSILRVPLTRRVACVTFGQPKVGNAAFAKLLESTVPAFLRVVYERDVVSVQPSIPFLFQHAGREVVIDDRGNCTTKPTFVEKTFMDSRVDFSAHSMARYVAGFKSNVSLTHALYASTGHV